MTNTPTCEWIEERLPLLGYGDLEAAERNLVLAHLDRCEACRAFVGALEASSAALSAVPLRHPDARRVRGLKAAVLAAVGAAGCPREVDLLARGSRGLGTPSPDEAGRPSPDAESELAAHLEGCAACREARAAFAQVGRALDLVPLIEPALAAQEAARAQVFARVGPRAPAPATPSVPAPALAPGAAPASVTKAGRLLRLPARRALTAAAAVLLGAGAFTLGRVTAPPDQEQALALKQSVDLMVRANHPQQRGWVAPAITAYTQVVESVDLEADASRQARREVEALRALERLQLRSDSPSADDLEDLMVEFPDATSTFACALEGYRSSRGEAHSPLIDAGPAEQTGEHAGERVGEWRGRPGTIPINHAAFADALRWISQPRLRQAILLQQAIRLEDLGDLAQARECYQQVLGAMGDTPAARFARERLERLGGV